jgi:hypothetical protein
MAAAEEFRLKPIEFLGSRLSILCQNENGPCPLLAIANVLILRGMIRFHPDIRSATLAEVVDRVADKVFELNAISEDADVAARQTNQLQSVIHLIPQLQRGLDVNVRFDDVRSFEYTQAFDVFDAFGINLYHGWVPDPQAVDVHSVVHRSSYNEVTVKVAQFQTGGGGVSEAEGHVLENFLRETAAQLTFYGLMRLYEVVNERELGVFFRNDHFSTLFRYKDKLYSLVTDLGYERQTNVVWELLDSIDGNTEFVSAVFTSPQSRRDLAYGGAGVSVSEDADLLLAMQMSLENGHQVAPPPPAAPDEDQRPATPPRPTDNFKFTTTTVKRNSTRGANAGAGFIAGKVQPPTRASNPRIVPEPAVSIPPAQKSGKQKSSGCVLQ